MFIIVSILSIWYNAIVSNDSGISEEDMIAFVLGPKFSLGQVCITPNAMSKIPRPEIEKALQRHARGDGGELCEEDWQGNDISLKTECRILSAYRAGNGVQFWIITESDRRSTTVLLPEDY